MRIPCLKCVQAYLGIEAHANLTERCVFYVDEVYITLGMGLGPLTAEIFQINFDCWRVRYSCG